MRVRYPGAQAVDHRDERQISAVTAPLTLAVAVTDAAAMSP